MGLVADNPSVESTDIYLSSIEQEHLFALIESSLRVNSVQQFFLWTQGELQSLIPHEVLLVGASDREHSTIDFQKFSGSRYFDDIHFDAVTSGEDALLNQMIMRWMSFQAPFYLSDDGASEYVNMTWLKLLKDHELRNFLAHGVLGSHGEVWTFFVFGRLRDKVGERQAYLLKLLMPYLHTTYVRLLNRMPSQHIANTEAAYAEATQGAKQFSKREIEVLTWLKEGKTNWEVAQILALSPLTIKNHVQRILRKLGVSNRCHAVSKAAHLGLLKR